MDGMIVCGGCKREFPGRDLFTRSLVVESCRGCGHIIKQTEGFAGRDSAAMIADDIAQIDEWVESESRRFSLRWQSSRPQGLSRDYMWSITGDAPALRDCPDGCAVGLAYNPDRPRVVAVRVTAIRPGEIDIRKRGSLINSFALDGLQFWGEQRPSATTEGDGIETEWGAYQYLGTFNLDGLLSPVLGRLFGAMRAALALP
jgi:hypothetical protein